MADASHHEHHLHRPHLPHVEEGELEHDAIGFRSALAVGLASAPPAYSLTAVIGTVHERFFGRKAFEAVDPQVATGEAPA